MFFSRIVADSSPVLSATESVATVYVEKSQKSGYIKTPDWQF
jgi:hypothetical protein